MSVIRTMRTVRPNKGLEMRFRKQLTTLIDQINRSVIWFLGAEFKRNPPKKTAQDVLPSRALSDRLKLLRRRWMREVNSRADVIVDDFIKQNYDHMSAGAYNAFKRAGMTVSRRMTRTEQDVMRSLIIENVDLIKTIPQKYFNDIDALVQRSVQQGRDLKYLSDEIEQRYHKTRLRAEMIARDQNNKAAEQMSVAKNQAMGIVEGVWIHTSAGKTYRATHIAMNGKTFRLDEGMYDSAEGRNIMPGELVNCYCTYRPVIPTVGKND